ncbi:MAG: hypothetical protein UW24_C0022G0004 [Parcubacteria group bacterium GW2011_GWA2_44_12]|nr:MAG: hypothetical protein UW24_C0022G0004 [Parcubacteria group bacterium GW2011_GWA2_44_12]
MLSASAIFAIICTVGFVTTPLSIFERVVYLTPDFLAKSSCVRLSFAHNFLMICLKIIKNLFLLFCKHKNCARSFFYFGTLIILEQK